MDYTHAILLLEETGEEINEDNLTAVLEAAGADVSTSGVKAHVAALEGVDVGGPEASTRAEPVPEAETAVEGDSDEGIDTDVPQEAE